MWLEHLVYSTMERRAATCVAGRIGSDVLEYDVAAVVAGRNVVVECKDGRFGQNDLPNLFVADASVFPAYPEKNPTLTNIALSWRTADGIADRFRRNELG